MNRTHRSAVVAALIILTACGRSERAPSDTWVGERLTENGISTVRTLSGSVWQHPAQLVEEISIGTDEADSPYLFNQIVDLDFDGESIYVLDGSDAVLRVFDSDGVHRQDIGRPGEGPGEFRRPEKVAVDRQAGHIFVRDYSARYLNVYDLSGRPLDRWHFNIRFSGTFPMQLTGEGELYSCFLNPVSKPDIMCRFGPEGTAPDTVFIPLSDERSTWVNLPDQSYFPVPFSPDQVWAFSADRVVAAGFSNRYRILLKHYNGSTLAIERAGALVPLQPREREWYRARVRKHAERALQGAVYTGPDVPEDKPAFDGLVFDSQGRLWVFRPGPGIPLPGCNEAPERLTDFYRSPCWRDSLLIEVFAPDGRFLGNVEAPPGFDDSPKPVIRGDVVIAAFSTPEGSPRVKKLRLVLPPSR
jgi:hypothetical protein